MKNSTLITALELVIEKVKQQDFVGNDLMLTKESIKDYLHNQFPNIKFSIDEEHFEIVMKFFDYDKFRSFRDLDLIFSLTKEPMDYYKEQVEEYYAINYLAIALSCVDPNYRNRADLSSAAKESIVYFLSGEKSKMEDICSFCGTHRSNAKLFIKGNKKVFICGDCAETAYQILLDEKK